MFQNASIIVMEENDLSTCLTFSVQPLIKIIFFCVAKTFNRSQIVYKIPSIFFFFSTPVGGQRERIQCNQLQCPHPCSVILQVSLQCKERNLLVVSQRQSIDSVCEEENNTVRIKTHKKDLFWKLTNDNGGKKI